MVYTKKILILKDILIRTINFLIRIKLFIFSFLDDSSNNKIFLLSLNGIGDAVFSSIVVKYLSQRGYQLSLLVKKDSLPIYENDKRIKYLYSYESRSIAFWIYFFLFKNTSSIVIIIHGSFVSSVIALFVNSKNLSGMLFNTNHKYTYYSHQDSRYLHKILDKDLHLSVLTYCSLFQFTGRFIYDPRAPALKFNLCLKTEHVQIKPLKYICIAPDTNWLSKNISLSTIKNIIESTSHEVIIIGKSSFNITSNRKIYDFRNKLSLQQCFHILKKSYYLFCADSLFLHIATFYNIRVGVFFTSTNYKLLSYYFSENIDIIDSNLYCSPCYNWRHKPVCTNSIEYQCKVFETNVIKNIIDKNRL
jgi:ADP-heptose:LPS heptosyltransferase